jgi:DNA-binding NarL/FixJ family response regulator
MRFRVEDKTLRKSHPNSLANTRSARPSTHTDRPNKPRKVTPQIREQVIQLREDGYSCRVIREKAGLSVSTVKASLTGLESQ